ncbi:unnamed protein product [Calicophoron daubneyi]|uniref:Uncharacterized protein n=1 Tax=Calicophoron daubneyi TaxID=300641 RepID=A0AAV2T2V0_CALDB
MNFMERTPAGSIQDRTKFCLARIISNELARQLSWQSTPNRQAFGTTCLWSAVLDTLAANSTERESSANSIRQTCVAWFQNARDRRGGRTRKRHTCPQMPLVNMTFIKFIYCLTA